MFTKLLVKNKKTKNSRQLLNQSDVKPKPIETCHVRFRALYARHVYSLGFLIGWLHFVLTPFARLG